MHIAVVFQQSQIPHHSLKIAILIRRPARLTPDIFFKIQAKLGPTRKARARLTTLRSVASEDGDL